MFRALGFRVEGGLQGQGIVQRNIMVIEGLLGV